MKNMMDYWLAQSLSLVFYLITLIIYNRARKEYVGGKIATAINLIMLSLAILFLSDFADYFLRLIVPIGRDSIIVKILLKLIAICVLFFGGLRFFTSRTAPSGPARRPTDQKSIDDQPVPPASVSAKAVSDSIGVSEDLGGTKPTLGRYEILAQIGRGAMGVVYKGRDPKLDRLTAIKTIRFKDDFDEDEAERIRDQFYNEARVVAKLTHPNIVSIYDVGEDLDMSYLAMEYLEGETLDAFIKEGRLLPISACLDIICQVCDALEYLHARGVIHRDIKPSNIMVLEDGTVKVADFGVARAVAGSRTRTGVIKGTPYYMSPEQIKGVKVTSPSDIFSLGIVFYQMLTGRLPFQGENLSALMYHITTVDPEPAERFNPDIDRETLRVLNRALEKRLENRYPTAKQMGDELREVRRQVIVIDEVQTGGRVAPGPSEDPPGADVFPKPASSAKEPEQDDPFGYLGLTDILASKDEAPEPLPGAEETEPTAPETGDRPDAAVFESGYEATGDMDESEMDSSPGMDPHAREPSPEGPLDSRQDPYGGPAQGDDADLFRPIAIDPSAEKKTAIENRGIAVDNAKSEALFSVKRLAILVVSALLVFGGGFYFLWPKRYPLYNPRQDRIQGPIEFKLLAPQKDERQKELDLLEKLKQERKREEDRLLKIAAEKQIEQERLAQIAQERKEQERLAEIAEEKQKAEEKRAKIAADEQKARERRERLAEEKQKEEERLARLEAEKKEAIRKKECDDIERFMRTAEKFLEQDIYREAKSNYTAAEKIIDQSDFKNDATYIQYKSRIEKALMSEDMVFGAKGYVKFENQWVTPEAYENLMHERGFLKYKGKFIHYLKLKDRIEDMGFPVVQSFINSKYSGQLIHKKIIKLNKLSLKHNTRQQTRFVAFFSWEVWTFKTIGEGVCPLEILFDPIADAWKILNACRPE